MTLEEMKLAVCEKLPELIEILELNPITHPDNPVFAESVHVPHWKNKMREINWPTEGLQVCHEAEKLLTREQQRAYTKILHPKFINNLSADWCVLHATYKQRLEALCRVWWPERWS